MRPSRPLQAAFAVAVAGFLGSGFGCSGKKPPAAATRVTLEAERESPSPVVREGSTKRILSPAEQARVLRAMREAAGDHTPVEFADVAPLGLRWADVPAAVFYACKETEIAPIGLNRIPPKEPREYVYNLETVEGWPGTLTIRRVDGPEVYEAEATIGRFPDRPGRNERRDALLTEIATQMLIFGQKRQFND